MTGFADETAVSSQDIAAYLDFKLLTGLRKGDILQLRMSDLKEHGIHAHISKTDRDMVIEWTEALRDAVSAIRALKRPLSVLDSKGPAIHRERLQQYLAKEDAKGVGARDIGRAIY